MGYLLMLLSAFGLGAAHALEPGHGKTVVAAYLVGSRGRTIDAILLGGVVTATHTASVFVLAVASTIAAAYLVPDQVERAFALGAGLLVLGVGVWMISQRTRGGAPGHSHHHHDHSHETAGHTHTHGTASGEPGGVRLGSLVALGVSGGIVPCPAAVVLIPAAVGVGAVTQGLLLVVSFSVGLAVVLMATGILTLRAAGLASKWLAREEWARRLSLASACLITLLGLALTARVLFASLGGH